jgi:hypothetical protein
MAGEILHVFERDVLLEQVGDDRDAEAVGRNQFRQAGVLEAAFQHLPHGMRGITIVGEIPAPALGRHRDFVQAPRRARSSGKGA